MAATKLTKLELQIMEALWTNGRSAVREVQEQFPEASRPAYTTIQTVLTRLEAKKAVRRIRKIGNAHIFEAAISYSVQEVIQAQPVMLHLIEAGKLTMDDVREAERLVRELEQKGKK